MSLKLKFKTSTEIRRISLQPDVSLNDLRTTIQSLFLDQIAENFSLKYEDDDKDQISIVTDLDWKEAVSFASNYNNNLVLFIGEKQEIQIPQLEKEEEIKEVEVKEEEDEISKLANEFINLSTFELPKIEKDALEHAIEGAKEVIDLAKDKIQNFFEHDLPNAGNEIQNFLSKQGQNANETVVQIQDFVKNVEQDIKKNLESLVNQVPQAEVSQVVNAQFIQDVTISSGTKLTPEQHFLKVWELRNNGNCCWPEGLIVKAISGFKLSETEASVPSINAGETIKLALDLTSPSEPGHYRTLYRLFNSQKNSFFGDFFCVDIVVCAPPVYKYQSQLSSLVEMGFDESICKFLLDEHKGNIENCMAELVNN